MKKWLSAHSNCDICGKKLNSGYFYDFATKQGPWALGCETCFKKFGKGLGIGKGQKYDAITTELLEGNN